MNATIFAVKIRWRRVVYYAICLLPVAFFFLFLGGVFEGTWAELWFVYAGIIASLSVVFLAFLAPFVKTVLIVKEGVIRKRITIAGLPVYNTEFSGCCLSFETATEMVATSTWFGYQEVDSVFLYGFGARTSFAGSIETGLFYWTTDVVDSVNMVLGKASLEDA